MQIQTIKAAMATLWVSGVWAAGIASSVSSLPQWTMLATVGILPPLVLLWYWTVPAQSTSEAIQEVLR